MAKLGLQYLEKLSFPDFAVIDVEFKPSEKSLLIRTEGAWLEIDENEGMELGKGKLFFHSWNSFVTRKYDLQLNTWAESCLDNFESLKDICEIECLHQKISLRGFGSKSSVWIEYEINAPVVELEFEDSIYGDPHEEPDLE